MIHLLVPLGIITVSIAVSIAKTYQRRKALEEIALSPQAKAMGYEFSINKRTGAYTLVKPSDSL